MPRNEGFLDPEAGSLARFAWDLRALREEAGKIPYRVLAKRAGFCASTLSVAASGSKLPSLDVTLAYVQACGGDPELWRERWHALAAQHPPTHSAANVAPLLHVAPPYDADEHGEPARLGVTTLAALSDSSQRTDSDRESPAPGEDAVAIAVQLEHATATATSATPSAREEAIDTPRRRRRLRTVPISRVAVIALTLATTILGARVVALEGTGNARPTGPPAASASPAGTAMQQADALYAVIYLSVPMRADANDAVWDISGCRNLSNAQSKLRAMARKRHEQVEQLTALDVSKVPDSPRLVAALKHAWITSARSETAYANIAADLQAGCTTGAVRTDPNYQLADADAQAAAAAKAEAAQLWNAHADELGQLSITGAVL